MIAILRILAVWRDDAPLLLVGLIMAMVSAAALAGLSLAAGAAPLATGVTILIALRALGAGRVVLRYAERLVTHRATFRALTRLRMWLFHNLAGRSAGGLGFMRRGDALARMVGDVDSLDGLYLRILVPLSASLLLIAAVAGILGPASPGLAFIVCLLLLTAAVLSPLLAARASLVEGTRFAEAQSGLQVAALDALAALDGGTDDR